MCIEVSQHYGSVGTRVGSPVTIKTVTGTSILAGDVVACVWHKTAFKLYHMYVFLSNHIIYDCGFHFLLSTYKPWYLFIKVSLCLLLPISGIIVSLNDDTYSAWSLDTY